jgi:UDP-N-acetylmuramoylalanine--D-glutamate ligase
VLNDIVVFLKNCPAQVIGVTGTRGKSTTSALVAEIFKAAGRRVWLGGNIKISPLSFAERVQADDLVVLELSSWMLEHFKEARPGLKVAVFTNLLRDHLNTYDSMADYFSAKKGIFAGQTSRDIAVISADNIWTKKLRRATKAKIIWTSLKSRPEKDAVFVRRGEIIAREQGKVTRAAAISDLALQGEHNLANALLAIGAGRALDAPWNAMKKALRTFKGLPDRQEAVRVWRGVSFINDTTATTPDATIAALRVFPSQKTVLITGGTDKKLFFGELAREALKVKALVLLPGSATDKLRPLLDRNNVSYADVRSMKEAVASAAKKARPGDRVLLSPGAASFGLFKNEFDRGEQFVREVKRLR